MSVQNINLCQISRIVKIRETVLRAQTNNNNKKWNKVYKNRMCEIINSKIKYNSICKNNRKIIEKQLLRNKIKIKNYIKIIKDNYKNRNKNSMKKSYNKKRVSKRIKLIMKFKVNRTSDKFRNSNRNQKKNRIRRKQTKPIQRKKELRQFKTLFKQNIPRLQLKCLDR